MRSIFRSACAIVLCGGACLAAAEEADQVRDKSKDEQASLVAALRVPTRAAILKDSQQEGAIVGSWVQQTIEEKEKRAQNELVALKKKLQTEEDARVKAEEEKARRAARYEGATARKVKRQPLRMRLDFQVPEIDTFRRAAETCRVQKQLADDVVDVLTRLDIDRNGRLSGDEYRDACALVNGAGRLFYKLDANDDGFLSIAELDAARDLPKNGDAALRAGQPSDGKKLKNRFDANDDGVLDVTERKTLTMAFVEVALHAEQDGAFYRQVADRLSTSREIVAAKFARLELEP